MTLKLTPCPHCARHVRFDAPTCPFCTHDREADRRRARPVALAIVTAGVLATTPAAAHAALDGGTTDAAAEADNDAAVDAAAFAENYDRKEWDLPIPLYGQPPPPHSCGCETTHAPRSNEAVLAATALGAALLARRRRDDD